MRTLIATLLALLLASCAGQRHTARRVVFPPDQPEPLDAMLLPALPPRPDSSMAPSTSEPAATVTPRESFISWDEALAMIEVGSVATISQSHSGDVHFKTVDGQAYRTIAPGSNAVLNAVEDRTHRDWKVKVIIE